MWTCERADLGIWGRKGRAVSCPALPAHRREHPSATLMTDSPATAPDHEPRHGTRGPAPHPSHSRRTARRSLRNSLFATGTSTPRRVPASPCECPPRRGGGVDPGRLRGRDSAAPPPDMLFALALSPDRPGPARPLRHRSPTVLATGCCWRVGRTCPRHSPTTGWYFGSLVTPVREAPPPEPHRDQPCDSDSLSASRPRRSRCGR